MRTLRSKIAFAFALAIVSTQVAPWPGAAATPALSQSSVRIVTSSTGFLYSPVYVAAAKGYFKDEGLDVQVEDGGGGPNAVAAVVGGGADFAAVGLGNISHAIEHGQHLVVVADVLNNDPYVIVVRSQLAKDAGITKISTLAQRAAVLQHRTVGTLAAGGSSGLFPKFALSEAKLDPNSMTVINLENNPAQLASLKGGKIDAFVNSSPTTDQAIAEGFGYPLISGADIPSISGMAFIALSAQDAFVKAHPDTTRAVLRALRRAIDLDTRNSSDAEAAFYKFLSDLGGKQAIPENLRHTAWVDNESAYPKSLIISTAAVDKGRKILGIPASVTDDQMLSMDIARKVMAEKL